MEQRELDRQNKRRVGFEKESSVVAYLEAHGYRLVTRNFYCRQGEIDLIAWKDEYLVFLEVKYRRTAAFGQPEEAVDRRKQARIRYAARVFLYQNHYPFDTPCRFDVVGILDETIRVTENAFF